MGLSGALATSLTGLSVTQKGITTVAGNIANADTVGYTRKTVTQKATVAGGNVIGAHQTEVTRELDALLQRQMRTEAANGTYTSLIADYASRIDEGFGEPGSSTSLDSIYNNFLASVQALSASPSDYSAQVEVIGAAQTLTSQLNALSNNIQSMRAEAESGIADAVDEANDALQQIEQLNTAIMSYAGANTMPVDLLDERDRYVDKLAELMDVRVVSNQNSGISIFTTSGVALFDGTASTLSFDEHSTMTAETAYSTDPAERRVGTIRIGSGASAVDLLSTNLIRSGTIAAYVELRDEILPEVQGQLDEIASSMALALSNQQVDSTAATSGAQTGFDIDLGGLQQGNSVSVAVTDTVSGTTTNYTFIRVDNAAALPLDDTATLDPNDTVVGIDFSGGYAAAAAAMQAALGANYTVTNTAGSTFQFLDDGAANLSDVDSVSATQTITSVTGGTAELPFFVDAGGGASHYYTGSFDPDSQKTGFSARISINSALLSDPSLLVKYSTSPATYSGDTTRVDFLADRLADDGISFQMTSAANGSRTFNGSIGDYLREVVDYHGSQSTLASQRAEGQSIVVSSLEERFYNESGVDIDQELARLTTLQTSYAANARVMSTVKEMLDILMQM
ncbi:MAG: flagellar hook-associated protein FlgK [Hyphomicrobiales bacterium]